MNHLVILNRMYREMSMELLTVPEVAQRLKLSKSKVYLLCQQGQIPTITLGKSVRIPLRELEEWLSQQIQQEAWTRRSSG